MIPFDEYSFSIVPINDETKRISRIRLIPVSGSDTVEYVTTDTSVFVTPQIGALKIIRDVITLIDGDNRLTIPEEIIYEINDFEYLNYQYRKGIKLTVHEVDESGQQTQDEHNVVFSIMNQVDTEQMPVRLRINGLKFSAEITTPQHVNIDISYTNGDNVLHFFEEDKEVNIDGTFTEPIIIDNVYPDRKYKLDIYHYELEENRTFYIYGPRKPICGENPIVDKIEWEGRKLYIACPYVKQEAEGDLPLADWGFPMDYQTKGINLRSSIISSDADSYNFKCLVDGLNRAIPCIASYENRIYRFPDDQEFDNIFANDILAPASGNLRIIAFNFLINSMNPGDKCEFLKYKDINNTDRFIGIERSSANSEYYISIGGENKLWSLCTNNDLLNKWNTIFICFLNKNGINYCRALIPNLTNPFAEGLKKGDNLQYIPKENSQYFNVDRQDFDITVDITTNSNNAIKAYLLVYLYQYHDSPAYGRVDEIEIQLDGRSAITTTVQNDFAYAARLGFKIVVNNSLTVYTALIDDIKINNNVITLIDSDYTSEYSDNRLQSYITFNWSRIETRQVNVLTNVLNGYSGNFTGGSAIAASNTPMYFGGGGGNFAISHFSCKNSIINPSFAIEDVDADLFAYFGEKLVKTMILGYELTPKLLCSNENLETYVIDGSYIEELKGDQIVFFVEGINNTLLENKESDNIQLSVITKSTVDYSTQRVLTTFTRLFKNIKELSRVPYDIDFESDFDTAVAQFKEHYYAKQKRWGGDMGGGVNAELVYFDKGRKCLILEQHGDLYQGDVPAIAPAGIIGYGFPVSLKENPATWEDSKRFSQRNIRVAGLIQSINYHGYGMFDCWFKVPKGMTGLAICLWYFHYQEIYNYDRYWDFWVNEGFQHADGNLYKYDESVASGYGATWFVVNNEIDMELGSENTPYRCATNPNNDNAFKWFAPGLSMRQCIGVDTPGANYGLWMIDWERSKTTILNVINTYGCDPTDLNCWIPSSQLVWVKVKDNFDAVNSGATVRSCRFNNWLNERWNDGCGASNVQQSGIYKRSEMDVNNRTPLGELQHNSLGELIGLIEHYYDDEQYHKWSIDWQPTRTRLLIDDEEIAICDAFVPFNPMTMLVGCWFPSANVYDAGPLAGNYGTWAGIHANFDVANMEVKRIKFTPYSEQEASTEHMRYDCETYAQDGLRELVY